MSNAKSTNKKLVSAPDDSINLPCESPRQIIIDILATALVDIILTEKSIVWSVHGPADD